MLTAFVVISVFYSFYQSIKNININKVLAFILLIFYFVAWIFFAYDIIDDVNKSSIIKFSIFILINVCFYLYRLCKKQKTAITSYLLFYGSNSILLLFFLLMIGYAHDY